MDEAPPIAGIFLLVACLLPLGSGLAYAALWLLSVIWPALLVGALVLIVLAALFVAAVVIAD